ncbi:MAG: hypothetical protein N838_31345 [Thiohalocapsa sp. PB-PSB1]|jgi:hypothetical protein|nr:MAG: hypothetical protein N838_31345 [Thiohalocapsa sp. PB-PSB1]
MEEMKMKENEVFTDWVASIERGDCGFTYVRLYNEAPGWVRNEAINHFGKGTVFLPARQNRRAEANVAA